MEFKPSENTRIYGMNHFFNEISNIYNKNMMPAKILLSGKKGLGKSTLAYHIINYILSTNEEFKYDYRNFIISKNNRSYKLLESNSHPNFYLIDLLSDKKNIGKQIILIDRFSDSTIAYQHYGMGINLKFIMNINDYLLKNIKIDFTFLNTVNQTNMKKRLLKRKNLNRYDKFDKSFYDKVQKGFLKILKTNPKKYMKINSNLDINYNEKIILNKINDLILI